MISNFYDFVQSLSVEQKEFLLDLFESSHSNRIDEYICEWEDFLTQSLGF